ncbi:MAG: hypothetical protein QNM02_16995 [Acidimicrobiia bacterium]|nr:hypothetical protein [Acidimicrobiia bacterium]
MRSNSDQWWALFIALVTVVVIAYLLYRPKVQQSQRYQATVVPLANIMDVGFIIMSPAIVLLAGFSAPLVMLGVCLVAIAAGFAIAYNIRHYEPIAGTDDPLNRVERTAQWALLGASVINIAYYTLLLMALFLLPFGIEEVTSGRQAVMGTIYLGAIAIVGYFGGMAWLNRKGNQTTAFNLAAVFGILVAFGVFNLQEWLGGRWALGESTEPDLESFRKIIGLFAIVQGFEAARYIGGRFGAEQRISSMRLAQTISTVVFVALVASILVLFLPPLVDPVDGTAIFQVSELVGNTMPYLLLLAAIGSQTGAIIGATSSRSDMLVTANVPRKISFLVILIPAIFVVILTDINVAVNLASRVFAAYFLIQATLAALLARRKQNWPAVVGFVLIGLVMATIMIFGLPL